MEPHVVVIPFKKNICMAVLEKDAHARNLPSPYECQIRQYVSQAHNIDSRQKLIICLIVRQLFIEQVEEPIICIFPYSGVKFWHQI
jgi:hypothetical protein